MVFESGVEGSKRGRGREREKESEIERVSNY